MNFTTPSATIGFFVLVVLVVLTTLAGCQKPLHFPAEPLGQADLASAATRSYDTDADGQADYFTYVDPSGRITRIAYDRTDDAAADWTVDLDAIPIDQCRHLVIILDGIGYDVVKDHYDQGHLRMFHPPSRVVAPYPTLTDLSLVDILGYIPCRGFEAAYFDHGRNRMAGGSWAYLAGKNQPFNRLLQYRANLIWDAIGYAVPWPVFRKETNSLKRSFDRAESRELIAYLVSSAGIGTDEGADGQRRALRRVERLINQVIQETRGLVKVTMLADHGHSYTPGKRIELEQHLADRGWRVRDSLAGPRDVAYVRFGLETYASFATPSPAELAADLIAADGVEIATYVRRDAVVVLAGEGAKAIVRNNGRRYAYEQLSGDPLELASILATLQADAEGYYEADALLAATGEHYYPAPLQRIWRAHFALVANPPDVIVSLADSYFSGSRSFGARVPVASTHGSLNRTNSTTFIMSTAGPLPPLMRSRDIPKHLATLLGVPAWPIGKK